MFKIISFDEAIADSENCSKRHLLLGNGFSIGCRSKIFHYESLFNTADYTSIPQAKNIFNSLNTQDFEVVIKSLENAALIFPVYMHNDKKNLELIKNHAELLKEILISTIAKNHPSAPNQINEREFQACRKFLSHFLGSPKGGLVFTLNYDLLLYWTLMHENGLDAEGIKLKIGDSFGNDEDCPNADYVVWQGETAAHTASIYFLHGALHIFDSGSEILKYTWRRKGESLVEQVRKAISKSQLPLFVAEGTSNQKKNKIRHNAYLYQGLKVLTSNANTKAHCFFIFGHSLAKNDDHILMRLAYGRFNKLYIGIYGDPNSSVNKEMISRANYISSLRQEKYPLKVIFFDSSSANVWGNSDF